MFCYFLNSLTRCVNKKLLCRQMVQWNAPHLDLDQVSAQCIHDALCGHVHCALGATGYTFIGPGIQPDTYTWTAVQPLI